jgi:choline dehydrogenase-like flavoprotein
MLESYRYSSLDPLDASDPYDVCIIGSGPAGTILAKSLVENGVRTLMLESGYGLFQWLTDKRFKKNLADFEVSGDTDYPIENTRGMLLGGTSNFWTGRCERLHPLDFEKHPYTPKKNPWPITYNDLEPYYELAEKTLNVRCGDRSTYAPPRRIPFPLSPKTDISYLKELFYKIGVVVDDSPTATPQKIPRFFWFQNEVLPSFLKAPHFTLITGANVTRLLNDTQRNITGALVKTLNRQKKIARAKKYVIACGGIATPRLLLLSKSEQFPNGIGNHNDRVGRGFNEHPAVNFYGQLPHQGDSRVLSNKIGRSHQFYNTFWKENLGTVLPVFRQSWVLPHHNMPMTLTNLPRNTMAILRRFRKATVYIGVVIEMKISDSNRVLLSQTKRDLFGDPLAHLVMNYSEEDLRLLDRSRALTKKWYAQLGATDVNEAQITFSRHHCGTCRMGDNPNTSVVDKNLKVHDTKNLYLGGSEVFVTGGSMQPVLTITALAYRLGEHLVENR